MGDFGNIFRSLMMWLSCPGGTRRVKVTIEFERVQDLADMENQLRLDLASIYHGASNEIDGPLPQTCCGIPFELTLRPRS